MKVIRKGYRFRLEPSKRQFPGFARMAGARRWIWNWALNRRIKHYHEHHQTLGYRDLTRELTRLKRQPETRWLQQADAQALQAAVRDLDFAFQRFFAKHARFPRFKSKKRDRPTFRIPQRVKIIDGRVYVPKIGWVRVRQSRCMEGRITSATFTQNALGHWDVSFATEVEVSEFVLPRIESDRIVGIDQGLNQFIVLSNGVRITAPRYLRKSEHRLRRAQRRLSRCQRGSHRRERARRTVAAIYQRVHNQRRDFIHKVTTGLLRRYDGFCIQKLDVSGLARTKLAKSALDAGLGELYRQLAYKSEWYHKRFVVIDRWFPSSKRCVQCGALNKDLSLNDREWRCICGAVQDRDVGAAMNIRTESLRLLDVAAGHAETKTARREAVSLPMGAGLDEARIPRPRPGGCQG